MSRHRHDDANRATADTPTKVRLHVEWHRRRATRRTLLLLECGIVRHAPFAACGRTLWELLPEQPWFLEKHLPSIDALRVGRWWEAVPPVSPMPVVPLDAHRAVRLLERSADDPGRDDDRLMAEEYFRRREWFAEAEFYDVESARQRRASGEVEPAADIFSGRHLQYGLASWLWPLSEFDERNWNVLDFYLANYAGEYYVYGHYLPLHPDHRRVALDLIDDLFGHPLRPTHFDPGWRTSTAVALAAGMDEAGDFAAMPILAGALEDAGCDDAHLLAHCRADRRHTRGCWAIDRVLVKGSG